MNLERRVYSNTMLIGLIKDDRKATKLVSYTNLSGLNQPVSLSIMLTQVGGERSHTYMCFGYNMTALMFNDCKHRLYFCFDGKSLPILSMQDFDIAMSRLYGFTR